MESFNIISKEKSNLQGIKKVIFNDKIKKRSELKIHMLKLVYANMELILKQLKDNNTVIFEETNIYNLLPKGSYITFDQPPMEKYYNLYLAIQILLNNGTTKDKYKEIELTAKINHGLEFVLRDPKRRGNFRNSLINLISTLNDINNDKICGFFYDYINNNDYYLSFIENDEKKLIEVTNNMILMAVLEHYNDITEDDLY
tara:strand:- start:49441 stop:50040 length:600 start_codon:yes stop_codon:yes gene_type:complete